MGWVGSQSQHFLILEYVHQEPYRDQAMQESWIVEKGYLSVPDRPGLGVELNEESILANPYRSLASKSTAFATDGSVVDA